jgi:hypothetical protein
MSITENSPNSTETRQLWHAGSVEDDMLREYISYIEAVQTEFRCHVLPEYPSLAKHMLISLFLEEKRRTARLIRDKARLMSREDQTTCFWGAYLFWDDAISTIDWLVSQLNHAKPR